MKPLWPYEGNKVPPKTNMTMENQPMEDVLYLLLHCHVSFRLGVYLGSIVGYLMVSTALKNILSIRMVYQQTQLVFFIQPHPESSLRTADDDLQPTHHRAETGIFQSVDIYTEWYYSPENSPKNTRIALYYVK